ncbi:MAG: polyketide cyclase, partial [Planctomycetia bacterium]|nr:polyketide cyclase [Planctomycetia bacterium]
MTITESKPYETIRIKLDFRKPFAGTNDVEFAFKPEGNQTAVSWTMTGEKNFFCKLMGVFMDMDQMIGGDFEKGLASMNQAAKATAKR